MSKVLLGLMSASIVAVIAVVGSLFVASVLQEKAHRAAKYEAYAPPADVTRTEPQQRPRWREWPTTERLANPTTRSPIRHPEPQQAPIASSRNSA